MLTKVGGNMSKSSLAQSIIWGWSMIVTSPNFSKLKFREVDLCANDNQQAHENPLFPNDYRTSTSTEFNSVRVILVLSLLLAAKKTYNHFYIL